MFNAPFPRPLVPPFGPSLASDKWYLSGGISAANCVAAYAPKGAASLAASYVNLTGNATYNLTLVSVAPGWDATNGWIFSGLTAQNLNTNITGGNAYSAIIRFTGAASQTRALFGETTSVGSKTRLNIYPRYTTPRSYFRSGGTYDQATTYTSGVLAVTPAAAYANGALVSALGSPWTGTTTNKIIIGQENIDGVSGFNSLNCNIQAIAFYSTTITLAQVAAVTTAMNAL